MRITSIGISLIAVTGSLSTVALGDSVLAGDDSIKTVNGYWFDFGIRSGV